MKRMLSNTHSIARRRWIVAALLAACLVLVFPGISEAHAILRRSDPTADAILRVAPSHVRLWFSEELNPSLSTAEVLNATNQQRVDRHDAHLLPGDTLEMDVSLEPHLPPAVYMVIYRTVSNDDGHVVGGSFLFTVARPDGSVPTVSGSGTTGQNVPGISTLSGSSNGQLDGLTLFNLIMVTLVELGAVFWVGAQFWSLLVLQSAAEDHAELVALHQQAQTRFERRFSIPLLLMLLLANGGVLIGQAVTLTGGDVRAAFAPSLLASLVSSGSFGAYWLMRVIAISLLLGLALYRVQLTAPTRRLASLLSRTQLLLGLALFIAMTMSSHAAAAGPSSRVYAVAADWLHLVAAALWVGGMIFIATTYLPVLRRLPVAERAHALVTVLPYYSPLAVVGVLIMAVTGPLSATIELSSWEQLLSTAYGRVLTVKVILVGAMLFTSAFHIFVLRPRLQREALKYAYAVARLEAVQQTPVAASLPSDHEEAVPLPIPRRLAQEVKLREGRLGARGWHLTTVLRYEPLLGVAVLVCVGLLNVFAGTLTLSLAGISPTRSTTVTFPSTSPSSTQTPGLTASTGGSFREYPLPQADGQVMRLAIDHQGRVWFGEMGQNYLAVLDPRTQIFQQMVPPHGRYGMMGVRIAPDDTIWFAEQYANYIGHYFPATGRYQVYPLPTLTIPDTSSPGKTLAIPSGPNDVVLDAHGNVWFTELNADAVGRLDSRTGQMQHYLLGAKRSVQKLLPYGITVDPQGMVWFTESTNDHIGRLDPATGRIRYFTPAGPTMPLMEIASDPHGIIWATSFSAGLLLRFDPRTGRFTHYSAAPSGGQVGGLYGLAISAAGDVWVTILSANAVARLNVATQRFTYYTIPTEGSFALALALGPNDTIWFSEVDKIAMLRP